MQRTVTEIIYQRGSTSILSRQKKKIKFEAISIVIIQTEKKDKKKNKNVMLDSISPSK